MDDAEGNLWIGTRRGGLSRWREGKITPITQAGQALLDISGLYEDKDGVLWVASFGNGLGRFQSGKWTRYTKQDGLITHNLGYITGDAEGRWSVMMHLSIDTSLAESRHSKVATPAVAAHS